MLKSCLLCCPSLLFPDLCLKKPSAQSAGLLKKSKQPSEKKRWGAMGSMTLGSFQVCMTKKSACQPAGCLLSLEMASPPWSTDSLEGRWDSWDRGHKLASAFSTNNFSTEFLGFSRIQAAWSCHEKAYPQEKEFWPSDSLFSIRWQVSTKMSGHLPQRRISLPDSQINV